jgi:subtilisin family serine protease
MSIRRFLIPARTQAALILICLIATVPVWALKVETFSLSTQGGAVPAVQAPGGKPSGILVASGRLWVKFDPNFSQVQRASSMASLNCAIARDFPNIGWTLIALPPGLSIANGLNLLKGKPGVLAVDIDRAYRANKVPNDPLFSSQYALSQIDAPAGWEYETGYTSTVTIAMIDTGIDGTQQPDLDGKLLNSGGFKSQFCDPDQSGSPCVPEPLGPGTPIAACDHATRTSGVAAAETNNGLDVAGVSWGAKLISLRVFNTADCASDCSDLSPFGNSCSTDDAAIVSAIEYAVSMEKSVAAGNVVINMSLGASGTSCLSYDSSISTTAVANAIALSTTTGIPLAISAGNDGGSVNAPANCAGTGPSNGVIPVGADDQNNSIAYFSSNGPELAANGVVAPGVDIETTDISSGTTGSASGTSFSAPHVAGLAALLLSAHSGASAKDIQNWIRGGADNIGAPANSQGAGRINVFKSLRLAQTGTLSNFQGESEAIAFPNPFRPSQAGQLSFSIPNFASGSSPTIKIYTITGQLVNQVSGLTWNGRNSAGHMVASGTYIFLVTSGGGNTKGRFSVIR